MGPGRGAGRAVDLSDLTGGSENPDRISHALIDCGDTEMGGAFPVNCSGGVLSSNPIRASGLLRFAEAANQVRGCAGDIRIDRAKVALGTAYGANSQYFIMWVPGAEQRPLG